MIIYADEKFYNNAYLCGKTAVLTSDSQYFFREASRIIDRYTSGKIDAENVPESVKMCCCELAENLFTKDKNLAKNNGISSESVGGWSVNYFSRQDIDTDFKKAEKNVIFKWLADTGLLFRGVK